MNKNGKARLTVMALGLRGIPNIPGGVESHAAELYPRLQALGVDVTVVGRTPYKPAKAPDRWRGVKLRWVRCPQTQGVEALVHTFLGVIYAAVHRPDVLHIHAVGPWLMVPLAKLLGLKVLVTHHGEDYLREKWNPGARALLRLGERLGMNFADERIVISSSLLELARSKYARSATLIPNGVSDAVSNPGDSLLQAYGLERQRFIVQVSRLVPEKRQLDLIAAFKAAALPGWKLLLVGGAQGSQRYANLVKQEISGNDAIVNTGFLSLTEVRELLAHAGVFALPSSHEGLPISLLEAMKAGTPSIASDIPANREIRLDEACYFKVGDVATLAQRLREFAGLGPEDRSLMSRRLVELCARFDWSVIAESTLKAMERAANTPSFLSWPDTKAARPH